MPLIAYIGLPRQGKTYEVVTTVIYKSLSQGRRVVSNIAGLDRDAMLAHFESKGGNPGLFGELVQVTHDDVMKPHFWRTDRDRVEGVEAFIQPGDVLALDEIWRFWSGFGLKSEEGEKRPARVMNFFRMHGQFSHPVTGYICEVALITQDLNDIHRSVKGIVDQTFMMTKLTSVGMSNRYRVDIFEKTKINRRPLRSLQRSYEPELFSFYKSHSQRQDGDAEAVEERPDDRGNLLKGALFKIIIPVGLLVGAVAVWTVIQFFKPKQESKPVDTSQPVQSSPAVVSHAKSSIDESDEWRVVGWILSGDTKVIVERHGKTRTLLPPVYKLTGLTLETFLPSGEAVTPWTGGNNRRGIIEQATP